MEKVTRRRLKGRKEEDGNERARLEEIIRVLELYNFLERRLFLVSTAAEEELVLGRPRK